MLLSAQAFCDRYGACHDGRAWVAERGHITMQAIWDDPELYCWYREWIATREGVLPTATLTAFLDAHWASVVGRLPSAERRLLTAHGDWTDADAMHALSDVILERLPRSLSVTRGVLGWLRMTALNLSGNCACFPERLWYATSDLARADARLRNEYTDNGEPDTVAGLERMAARWIANAVPCWEVDA